MKTLITVLPIYDRLSKQCFERGEVGGVDRVIPIFSARHRLPSFQWLDNGDGATSVTKVEIVTRLLSATDITSYFVTLPTYHAITGNAYFSYDGDTLNYLIPEGTYYLRITMDTGHIYYSEYFFATCVYRNLMSGFTNFDYETFTTSGTIISSAINSAGNGIAYSTATFAVIKGETYKLIFYCTKTSGTLPTLRLYDGGDISNIATMTEGLNEITFTATSTKSAAYLIIQNTASNVNFSATEMIMIADYSEKYLIINFYNTCDLNNMLYHMGFAQTVFLESEPMEMTFPQEERGIENGEGRFVRTFARQIKKYVVRTKEQPDYMVEVFNRMKLHDFIELIDLVGDTNDVYNLEVEADWLWDDKYYASINLTFDYNEAYVVGGCCNNLT